MHTVSAEHLQSGLTTKCVGRMILFFGVVKSTNESAKRIALQGAQEGTVVVAEVQTGGRGRFGRKWFSPAGGLWLSVVLRPKISPADAMKLSFVAGLAVAQTLHEAFALDVETKWPNDVLIGGRKVCGILSETSTKGDNVAYVIVGIGVNANFGRAALPKDLQESATSLQEELGRPVELEKLFTSLLKKLELLHDQFLAEGSDGILAEWKRLSGILGKEVEVVSSSERFVGHALDVDPDGALVVVEGNGSVRRVFSADVSLQ